MEELKLKAWNIEHKKMYSAYSLFFNENLAHCESKEGTTHTFGFIDLELLKPTGLKDENGVDIYEGDILRSIHFIHEGKAHYLHHVIQWSDKYHGWIALSASSMNENDGSPQLFVYTRSTIDGVYEVVGNIHETPDLLNKAA